MSHGFEPAVVHFRTNLSEDGVRNALDEVLVRRWKGRRTNEPGAWAVYRTGSATALRLLGVYSARGARRFPLVIRADQTDDGGERAVRLIIDGDEGPYLIYPQRAQRQWRGNVDRIAAQLNALLTR